MQAVLGSFVPTELRIPAAREAAPLQISLEAADALAGYEEYGS